MTLLSKPFLLGGFAVMRYIRPRLLLRIAALLLCATPLASQAVSLTSIVAAENFYGDVAQQIGGTEVHVTSILSNPDQDPHLFEVSPSVARAVSGAGIVIYNGIGYDPWIEKLLAAARNPGRTTIVVADLAGRKPSDNPHIWYDPATMLALAATLTADLSRADPAHAPEYQQRFAAFRRSLAPIETRIAALRHRLAGIPVTATEPVFGYMLEALGMPIRNTDFQLAVMNDTEPSASEIAAFENDINTRRVRMLVYNSQATSPMAERILGIARTAHIPIVAATETEPSGKDYQRWISDELDAVERALPPQP